MKNIAKYPINYISEKTGLSKILIRTWENRYDFLRPKRSETNRRFYTEEDLEKLQHIKAAIDKGFRIGQLANMNFDEIKEIAGEVKSMRQNSEHPDEFIIQAMSHINNFDSANFNDLIRRRQIGLPKRKFIMDFVFPLLDEIGSAWQSGNMGISNEHFASEIIHSTLGSMIEIPDNPNSPSIVICTPQNQIHELVALALAVIISVNGFRVIYIGSSVPAEEIILSTRKTNAHALVLSIIYPNDDPSLIGELKKIEKYIKNTDIYIGGNSAFEYFKLLKNTEINYINNIDEFLAKLKDSRKLK